MVIINTGGTGTGKTTRTRYIIQRQKKYPVIFDVNCEYPQEMFTVDNLQDMLKLTDRAYNCLFVFEEATIFFSSMPQQDFLNFLVRQRHQGNDFIFNFHSLRSVPLYIIDYVHYFIIGKTNDLPQVVNRKYSDTPISEAYNEVRNNPDNYFYKVLKIR